MSEQGYPMSGRAFWKMRAENAEAELARVRAERDEARRALDFIADGNRSLARDALLKAKLGSVAGDANEKKRP